jgi:hypothetical protein
VLQPALGTPATAVDMKAFLPDPLAAGSVARCVVADQLGVASNAQLILARRSGDERCRHQGLVQDDDDQPR